MTVEKTLAYYDMELIMAVKSWKVQKVVYPEDKLLDLTTNIKMVDVTDSWKDSSLFQYGINNGSEKLESTEGSPL